MTKHDLKSESIRIGTLVQGRDGRGVADYIRQILPYGFESLSLFFWQTAAGVDWPRLAAEVRDALGDSGVVISSLGLFGNPLVRDDAVRYLEECIDHAPAFGCDLVAGFTGRLPDVPLDQSLPRFREVWGPLAQRAADLGVRIAFENCPMGGSWQRGDHNIAHSPDAWERMFNELPMDNLGLQWEPCHQMTQLIDPLPQLKKWVHKILNVHGKDASIHWDVIREHGINGPVPWVFHRTPGFGDSNWTDIISVLRANNYTGSIDIEGWHDPVYRGDLEMTGQVYGLNYLKRCRGGNFVPNPIV
ncbi:MAG: sugar phosphate isomerase/epimerase [Chloroflexi bacterium]|nr:sugar phosphate isomerase/epimerase [Chloroflexota bacterium]